MTQFYPLRVIEARTLTEDAKAIGFDTTGFPSDFQFKAGQYLTLKFHIDGEEYRRSYSVSAFHHGANRLEIGVKRVAGGTISNHINDNVIAGTTVDVMLPEGHFVVDDIGETGHHVFFAAGSGITPVLSMIREIQAAGNNPITLFFGNRSAAQTMYRDELNLIDADPNVHIVYVYSDGSTKIPLTSGRIDFGKTLQFYHQYLQSPATKAFYVCGPSGMMNSVKNALIDQGINEKSVHMEYFVAPDSAAPSEAQLNTAPASSSTEFTGTADVTIILDDEEVSLSLDESGDMVLDAALDHGLDAPFSCKGGVCTTCRAKLMEGTVRMDNNYALTDDEIEEGYILTCQSHPTSAKVVVSYDD